MNVKSNLFNNTTSHHEEHTETYDNHKDDMINVKDSDNSDKQMNNTKD